MGRFFANQKLDEAGMVGITLQKLLIFFMVLDATWLVLGYSFFGALMSFLFHFVVLMGVYRRRTSVLLIYTVFNVIVFVLAALAVLFVLGSLASVDTTTNDDYYYAPQDDAYSMSYLHRTLNSWRPSNSSKSTNATSPITHHNSTTINNSTTPHNNTIVPPVPHGTTISTDSSDVYYTDDFVTEMYFVASIAMLFSVIVLYCKIYSTVLAYRMRKILLTTPTLPVHAAAAENNSDSDTKPLLSEQAFEDVHPVFTHPGFVPYPMAPQFYPGAQGAMMPPHFMHGQQPVFYTFAPMPQYPSDDKL